MYISVRIKFSLALIIAIAWFLLCSWLAWPWINELASYVGYFLSIMIVFLIALLPGFMNMFLMAAYLVDERPQSKVITTWPGVSFIIAALNEEKFIAETVKAIANQYYEGDFEIIVVDNDSTDRTFEILQQLKIKNLVVVQEKRRGKSFALNKGLALAKYEYIATVDADTFLLVDALEELVIRLLSGPSNTAAVAGSVYVKNSRESFITELQEWDYFHSIAVIKRMQSMLQGTLVAQGAFSLYKKSCINEIGGWQNTVGEDIVLTWGLLAKGYRIDFAEKAISFTSVPTTYLGLFKQRSRWARGMFEAFHAFPKILVQPRLATFIIYWDLFFPAIDATFFLVFLPGMVAALFGYYFIVGPMTLAVLPITFLMNLVWFIGQRNVFHYHHLKVRANIMGFIFFIFFYYPLILPSMIYGYLSAIFMTRKSWGTK